MTPGTVKTDSQVEIHDSCNQCCCFQWKRKLKGDTTQKKVERQVTTINFIEKDPLSRRTERTVTELHLDASSDDVQIVMDYTVAKDKE